MVIGLCGRMGTGKSIALRVFSGFGFTVIDCDAVSRTVCGVGMPCLQQLCAVFGDKILNTDGSLNRSVLAEICFASEERTRALNAITHRHILEHTRYLIQKSGNDCVVAAPLLFESGFDRECDVTLALTAPFDVLLFRMQGRFDEQDFKRRLNKQYTDEFLIKNCDYVIENSGTIEQLKEKIQLFLQCIGKYGRNMKEVNNG